MALETIINISDLNKNNPTSSDPKSQGDDHIRNLKNALLNAFAGLSGAIYVTGTDGGAADVYTLTPSNALPAYGTRMLCAFAPTVNNTGACTINISGLGAKSIKSITGAALTLGDLIVGQLYLLIYTGTEFRLTGITKNYVDQIVVSGTVPGVNDPANAGKFYTTDGTNGGWGAISTEPVFVDKGNSGTTTQTLDYSAGQHQRITNTGAHTIATSNWPATGKLGTLLLELANAAAFTVTWPTVNWVKADGSFTTTFASNGVTLQASGIDFILLWSRNNGTTIYGKVVR